jgi:hypothetical protein
MASGGEHHTMPSQNDETAAWSEPRLYWLRTCHPLPPHLHSRQSLLAFCWHVLNQLSQNQRKMSYSIRHERILLEQAEQDRQPALQSQAATHAAKVVDMQKAVKAFKTGKEQAYDALSTKS